MNVFAWILGVILAAGFGLGGITKIIDLDRAREHFGFAKRQYQLIGLSEVAGAAGVVVGLLSTDYEWVALAAASGLCVLLIGALLTHARVEDEGTKIVPAIAMLCITIAFMIVISLR